MSLTDYLLGVLTTSGISAGTYSVTDLTCQLLERRYPVLKLQRTKTYGQPPVVPAGDPDAGFLEVDDPSDLEDWKAIEDDHDGLLNEEGWPKGRCFEGLERTIRRGLRKVSVKLKIDWVDWASVVRYNVIPLAIYNPVGYSWYFLLNKWMPGDLVFDRCPLWHFLTKWGSSLGAWILLYKVVRKCEFYRNADFHDRCRAVRHRKKRLRFAEIVLMAATQTCIFLFVSDPIWQRTAYLAYETVDTFLLYWFIYLHTKSQLVDDEAEADERPPYTILKTAPSHPETATLPAP
jgi:hypothetical protein